VRALAAVALAVACRAGAFAQDEPVADPNVPPSVQGEELQQIEARRRQLFQLMLAEPNNLDVAFEYAGLSARVGDIEGAIGTLERMLIFAPG
jgi:hypothetical protein